MDDKFKGISVSVNGILYKQEIEMSGAFYYDVNGIFIFASPYFETTEPMVMIEIVDVEGNLYNSEYSFFNVENEIEEYCNLVKMLITNVLIKS